MVGPKAPWAPRLTLFPRNSKELSQLHYALHTVGGEKETMMQAHTYTHTLMHTKHLSTHAYP